MALVALLFLIAGNIHCIIEFRDLAQKISVVTFTAYDLILRRPVTNIIVMVKHNDFRKYCIAFDKPILNCKWKEKKQQP